MRRLGSGFLCLIKFNRSDLRLPCPDTCRLTTFLLRDGAGWLSATTGLSCYRSRDSGKVVTQDAKMSSGLGLDRSSVEQVGDETIDIPVCP